MSRTQLVRASDQSIIDRKGIMMQIFIVAGLKIVLFTSRHTVTNFMSDHSELYKSTVYVTCSQVECLRTTALTETRPKNRLVRIRVIVFV